MFRCKIAVYFYELCCKFEMGVVGNVGSMNHTYPFGTVTDNVWPVSKHVHWGNSAVNISDLVARCEIHVVTDEVYKLAS